MNNKLLAVFLAVVFLVSLFVWEVVLESGDSTPTNSSTPVPPSAPAVDSAYTL